jgi:hypothetical protein
MPIETETYTLPDHWAPALVNADGYALTCNCREFSFTGERFA